MHLKSKGESEGEKKIMRHLFCLHWQCCKLSVTLKNHVAFCTPTWVIFTFQTQPWHHTHLTMGLPSFNVKRTTRCDTHNNNNGATHAHPPHTPTLHAAITCPLRLALLLAHPHMFSSPRMPSPSPLYTLSPSLLDALAHPLPCLHPCIPCTSSPPCIPSPSLLLALAHPLTFTYPHPRMSSHLTCCHPCCCMPSHTLSPSHTITLARPLTLAVSCPGLC